jgi:2-polyprenyl-3-methyl-5-hydroxy-6-metoxy-1,4-benzoquinol methylase
MGDFERQFIMKILKYLLHPFSSAKSIYNFSASGLKEFIIKWHLRHIKRGYVDRCWCGGGLVTLKWKKIYGRCMKCGCYVNKRPPLDTQELYSQDLYWNTMQKYYGYPTFENRAELYEKDGRLAFWLNLINKYGISQGTVIEVGCTPGVLLSRLQKMGYRCIGVEPDPKMAEWMHQNMGIDVTSGVFPDIDLPNCDLFLAFDVIEHSSDPKSFMLAVEHLLNPGGVAIIQTPIERYNCAPPFGEGFNSAFKEYEHLFLFTNKAMIMLSEIANLEIVTMDERLWLLHEVCIFRKKTS